ncbi:hypothetical protein PAPYR_838 [Paratrimastix pyriformis]|uniref:Autophagy-related protein 27 n=1 Tax=Paratrimastix pyriformis TaxID=342808 RepID=A0ABQ8V154_9EUKA|nr:hypothetical protein PAPYR_838 [Paratrimastix pyriformis]
MLLSLLVLLLVSPRVFGDGCIHGGFDFSTLSPAKGITASTDVGDITLNPCGTMTGDSQFCSFNDAGVQRDCGRIDQWSGEDSLSLTLTGGDFCTPRMGAPRSEYGATIYFRCDSSAGVGTPKPTDAFPASRCTDTQTEFVFEWRTSLVCKGGLSFGGVMLIIILVCTLLYLGCGFGYLWFRKGARGLQAIPNWAFWKALPRLVLDGFLFAFSFGKKLPTGAYSAI